MTVRFYSSTATETTLAATITAAATTVNVASTTGFPALTPFTLALDYEAATEELVEVTAVAGLSLTVTRSIDGTSAVAHTVGARVRHVSSARDFSDSRAHEQATSGVHGTTGAIVDTGSPQTLASKTLTSPVINGGTWNGSIGGGPRTITGTTNLNGITNLQAVTNSTNLIQSTQPVATSVSIASIVTADSFDRFRLYADGKMEWGPGNVTRDTTLFREAAGALATTDSLFRSYRASSTNDCFSARVAGDSQSRWRVEAGGTMTWGAGGVATGDTNLYRSAADTLKTDDSLIVTGAATVGGNLGVTGSITSAVTTATGVTAAAGWTVTSQTFRETAGTRYANITLNRSGATIVNPGGTTGNITPDLQVATTVPAGFTPSQSIYIMASTGVNDGSARINPDNTIDLLTWEPGQDILSGANLRISWTYV